MYLAGSGIGLAQGYPLALSRTGSNLPRESVLGSFSGHIPKTILAWMFVNPTKES